MFRTVDRSPGLHQGLRSRVSVGTLSLDQTSPVSGPLIDSCLFGAGSQAGRPVSALALLHPRECDKREEVRSRALADCKVSRHDHRYRGRQGFSVSGASREIPDGSGELLYHGRSPGSALAGDPRSPDFARAAGSSRSPSDVLSAVASQGALVPRVRPSLSSGAFAPGSETGSVLVNGEGPSFDGFDSGHLLRILTCIRTRLVRGVALTSSINTCPGCGRTRRSCCTSVFSR